MDNVEERWKEKLMENSLKLEKRNDDDKSKLMFKIDKKDQTIQSTKEDKNKRWELLIRFVHMIHIIFNIDLLSNTFCSSLSYFQDKSYTV